MGGSRSAGDDRLQRRNAGRRAAEVLAGTHRIGFIASRRPEIAIQSAFAAGVECFGDHRGAHHLLHDRASERIWPRSGSEPTL